MYSPSTSLEEVLAQASRSREGTISSETDVRASVPTNLRYIINLNLLDWPSEDKTPDDDPLDLTGHGTHVAGIIAAKADTLSSPFPLAPTLRGLLSIILTFSLDGLVLPLKRLYTLIKCFLDQ